ncbi:hypothetical protein [Propionicimonas sp.]|uniref:hypothetical protein n=1 Tax=Propionicimonas sp. TaxID=1955623 RepID=UPI0039E32124
MDDDIVLRSRDGVTELIVNGVFAMDSAEVSSELALADAVAGARRVLVGGLGLGYTVARLLDGGAGHVRVVELSAALVDAARSGATPQLGALASDPRVDLRVGDIADAVGAAADDTIPPRARDDGHISHTNGSIPCRSRDERPCGWDAIVLDVDNGPTFLIHDHNADLYRVGFLRRCRDALAQRGHLVVWCEGASPDLATVLADIFGTVEAITVPVARGARRFDYVLYRATRHNS